MKILSMPFLVAVLMLGGCAIEPVGVYLPAPQAESFCPPGQAKKGNCRPDEERGFCPPGQAKKGNC